MKKILVVDDEADLCFYVKKALERTGQYQVHTTSRPEEVFCLCQNEKPDLILLDVVMPNLKGPEIIKLLKDNSETREILIVVTSGLGEMVYLKNRDEWKWLPNRPLVQERGEVIKERSAERAAEAYGVDDYLAKPFKPETLLQVVSDVFTRAEKTQEIKEE